MLIYIPATVALLFKFSLFFYIRQSFFKNRSSKTLLALLLILTVTNIVELISYRYTSNPDLFLIFLRIYYVSMSTLLACLLQLSLLTVFERLDRKVDLINFSLAAMSCYLLLFTDFVIAGAVSNGYSVTRVPGELYWFVPLYSGSMLLLTLGTLIFGYLKSKDQFRKVRALYILCAVAFLAMPIFLAITLMAIGFNLNATVVLPIGVTCFLYLVTHAIKNEKLYDIRIRFPFSTRYRLFKAINEEFMVFEDGNEVSVRDRRRNHEKIYLIKAILDYGNTLNQKEIAEKMNMSESSLSRKRKEYGI